MSVRPYELRLGNYLEGGRVTIINDCEITIFDGKSYDHNAAAGHDPIPISEEWLKKFGFYQTEEGIKNFGKGNWGNGRIAIYFYDNDCSLKGVNVKYVHQLQNLYFALTDEELTEITTQQQCK